MKKFILLAILLFIEFPVLHAQTSYSVSDVYRVLHSYRLDDPYNEAFMRYGGELPALLMEAARAGQILPYTFKDQISTPISFEDIMTRMILEEEVYEDPWGEGWDAWGYDLWDESFSYYEGDVVEYEGFAYISLIDENEGLDPPFYPEYWEEYQAVSYFLDTDLVGLNIEYMIGMKKGKLVFKQPLFLHFYIPAEYTMEGFQKYIVSFAWEDCLEVLNLYDIVWHQFANRDWGLVKGEIFLWNDWEGGQGKFAFDLMAKISSDELPLHDSIDIESTKLVLAEYLTPDYEEAPYNFYLRNLSGYTGTFQIFHAFWGFTDLSYITTVDISPLLSGMINTEEFMSYGHALSEGKLKPVPGSEVDTLSHNGILTSQNSQVRISEIKRVEILAENPIPDYRTGKYSIVVNEIANLTSDGNNILLQPDREISRLLIEKVREGLLMPFSNDSLTVQMTLEEFNDNLRVYYEEFDETWYYDWDSTVSYTSWDGVVFNEVEYNSLIDDNQGNIPDKSPDAWAPVENEIIEYHPSELSMLQITYKYTFDAGGNIIDSEPMALGLNISSENIETGLMTPVCTFDFHEVEEALSKDSRAMVDTGRETRSMTDLIRDHKLLKLQISSRYIQYEY